MQCFIKKSFLKSALWCILGKKFLLYGFGMISEFVLQIFGGRDGELFYDFFN